MPELAEFWVEVVWLGSRWWPNTNSITGSLFTGSPVLNRAVHAFRSAAAIAACKVAAEDTFHCITTGDVSKHKLGQSLKKICNEGAYWGTAAGVYGAMESTVEEMRGRTDWKNAVIGGALAGAVMSAATAGRNGHTDKVVKDAIASAAIAAAAEFVGHRIRVDLGLVRFGDTTSKGGGIGRTREEGQSGAEPWGERQDVDPWVMGRGEELPLQVQTDPNFHQG
ncbi:unnamed protein product [Urochloa decumbens]|uniref:Uncharacterized protein n=1 Tax=Urochloa decumbens TaxID=240449 RepID=A0ABC8WK27_9POAL